MMDAGWDDPREARRWFPDYAVLDGPVAAREWYDAGFSRELARLWHERGVPVSEAVKNPPTFFADRVETRPE